VRDYDRRVLVTGSKDGTRIHQHDRIGDHISGYSLSHGVNHVTANAVYRMMFLSSPQIPDGRIQPYISLGIGFAVPHMEMNYYEGGYVVASAYEYQFHPLNLAFDLNIGSRFKVTNHFGFYTEIKTSYSHLHGLKLEGNSDEAEVNTSFLVNHIQVGVFASF
jgi:hypothetical protein